VATTTVLAILAICIVRAALRPYHAAEQRLHHCEERLAFVSGLALDRFGWLYGTPRQHAEPDDVYRKRLATVRARTFAV